MKGLMRRETRKENTLYEDGEGPGTPFRRKEHNTTRSPWSTTPGLRTTGKGKSHNAIIKNQSLKWGSN